MARWSIDPSNPQISRWVQHASRTVHRWAGRFPVAGTGKLREVMALAQRWGEKRTCNPHTEAEARPALSKSTCGSWGYGAGSGQASQQDRRRPGEFTPVPCSQSCIPGVPSTLNGPSLPPHRALKWRHSCRGPAHGRHSGLPGGQITIRRLSGTWGWSELMFTRDN